MGKYEPLKAYLGRLAGDGVMMTFAEIERVIGAKLPETSQRRRERWSNNAANDVMTAALLAYREAGHVRAIRR